MHIISWDVEKVIYSTMMLLGCSSKQPEREILNAVVFFLFFF